jgi:hypothetical protein
MKKWIVLSVMLVVAAGCGNAVRQRTLFPAIQDHWALLRTDCAEPDMMDAAATSGVNLDAAWALTKPGIIASIDRQAQDGTITALYADSKRENVRIMDLMVERYGL